ncbi:ABC transporter ATP-binding protein [candidate division WOR-3 bacterium]|nr:ABC transporter ATP-binding protein [candidate division WOR-3 bacterium]
MLKKLGRYLFKYKILLAFLIVVMVLVAILSGFTIGMITPIVSAIFGEENTSGGPGVLRWLIDWITKGDRMNSLIRLAVALVIIYGIKAPLTLLLYFLSDSLEQKTISDIRVEMFSRLTELSFKFHSVTESGKLLSKITNDTEKIEFALKRGVIDLGRNLFLLLVYVGLALWASWRLLLISLVLIPFILFVVHLIGKRIRGRYTHLRKQRAFLNALASEMLYGIRIIKLFGMERYEIEKFRKESDIYRRSYVKSNLLKGLLPESAEFLGAILAGIILVFGGFFIFKGFITPDKFLIFLGCAVLLQHPARQINLSYGDLQHGLTSMESALEIIEAAETIEDSGTLIFDSFKSSIKFKGVSFSYDSKNYALNNIDFTIKKGETLAIVGPSGSGKTTLVQLIPRFFDLQEGKLEIDGKDIREYTLSSLRSQIGMVPQDVILFNDSVRNNIKYGKIDASEEELHEVLIKSHLEDFVEKLPLGLDTIIGEKGGRISGGEKQRIAIARALLKDSPILILDEATSSLDSESEKLLQDAMAELLYGRTAVIIAHRLSTVINADRIVVLSNGKIIEEGTHETLLRKKGLYKKLYDIQFRDSKSSDKS